MRRALTVGLAASCLALAACRGAPRSSSGAEPPVRAPARSDSIRLTLGGLERHVVVVRDHARREAFARTRPASEPWVCPPDALAAFEGRAAILYVYPTVAARRFSYESIAPAFGLVTMTGDGRVVGVGRHASTGGRTSIVPPAPFRLALWVPPAWLHGDPVQVGERIALPAGVLDHAEPTFEPIDDPPPAVVRVRGASVRVEIAHTRAARACGLMYRDDVAPGHGMLFLYPDRRELRFWMVNTRVDLDVAYVDRDGTIRAIRGLTAHDVEGAPSGVPVAGALEVPRGWFATHGVVVGDRVAWSARVDALFDAAEP